MTAELKSFSIVIFQVMYKPGDIVWADLGSSYGWWPGTVAEKGQFPKSRFQDVKSDHPEHITKSETAETGKDLQSSLKPDDEAPSQSDNLRCQALKEVNSETGSPPRKQSPSRELQAGTLAASP